MVKIKSAKTLTTVVSAAISFLAPQAVETSENNDFNIGKPGTWSHSQVDTCLKNAPEGFAAKTNCYYEYIALSRLEKKAARRAIAIACHGGCRD